MVQLWLRQTKHIHDHSLPHIILGSTMTTTNETYPWSLITTTWFNGYISMIIHYHTEYLVQLWLRQTNISMIIHYHTEYLVQLWLRQTEHIHDHSLPHRILGSTMTTTNGTYPWSFITTHNTWFNYDYDKRNISMIIHYHTEYLVQLWLRQTKHIHDHSLPHRILGSTMTTTNGTYPWSFITTQNTWFNYDYDKRNISMIIHYHTEYLVQLWLRQTKHIHDHSLPHIILGSTMTTTNGTYPWSFITTQNTWFNYDYDKRNISMIIHYHTEYLVQLWLRQTKHIHDHSLPHRILGSTMTTTNETYPWSFITTQNTWFNYDYDKRNISMIIHYHTELGSTMTTTNETWWSFITTQNTWTTTNVTYPWSFITTQNTWFNYDYDKRNISMIIHYHTEYLVQLWLRQTEHIHDHSLPHIILGSTMTTTNETYPWSFITTQNTWFNYDYDKRNISMIIHYHTEYLVQLWLRQTKHIHDHSLPHRILGSTMTTTNGTYPWSFITTQNTWFNYDYDKRYIHDHSLPHRILGSTMTTTNGTYPWSFITTQNTWFNYDYDKRNISMIIHYHTEYLVQLWLTYPWSFITTQNTWFNMTTTNGNISMIIHYHTEYLVQLWLRQTKHIHDHSLPHRILGSTMTTTNETYPWSFITTQNTWFNYDYDKRNISMIIHYHTEYLVQLWLRQTEHIHDHSLPHRILGSTMTTTNETYPWSFITTHNTWFNYDYDKRNISMIIHYHTEYLVQLWLRQTKHIHDHSLPHIILGSTMTTTNETYPWSFITTHNTWFNYDYDKRNISMIIHYHT